MDRWVAGWVDRWLFVKVQYIQGNQIVNKFNAGFNESIRSTTYSGS